MNRTGVAVVAKDKGVRDGITLRNLWIHDVHGNVYDKHMNNGGIYMTALRPECEELTGVHGIGISLLKDASYTGSAAGELQRAIPMLMISSGEQSLRKPFFWNYGHENMQIRNNYVKEAGGDGITPMYALRPLVEHNMADSVACEINDRIYCEPGDRMGKSGSRDLALEMQGRPVSL